jgi:hypothetical protein
MSESIFAGCGPQIMANHAPIDLSDVGKKMAHTCALVRKDLLNRGIGMHSAGKSKPTDFGLNHSLTTRLQSKIMQGSPQSIQRRTKFGGRLSLVFVVRLARPPQRG